MYSTMRLGECYLEGDVVPKDAEEAFQWFQKSAELGNPAAVNMVGRCYMDGNGVEQDREKGISVFSEGIRSW